MYFPNNKSIILFDGICNLCNSSVDFIIKRDVKDQFRFASLQSEVGQDLIKDFKAGSKELKSVILIENGKAYFRSTAALRIAKHLKRFWKLSYLFIIIPPFIRNFLYDFIAANRYKWFGKKETCRLPSQEELAKFL